MHDTHPRRRAAAPRPGRSRLARPALAVLLVVVGASVSTLAQDGPPGPASAPAAATAAGPALGERDDVDASIDRAIAYLMARQNADGWINHHAANQTTMTSLALMAMAAAGHMPDDPTPQGEVMRKALAYVLRDDRIDKEGYFGNPDGSRMYGHGIITLMLTEMLGHGVDAAQDELIRKRCQAAVDMIIRSQKHPKAKGQEGGWRYAPDSGDSDLSVSVWQTMALRSAHNAGLDVPVEAVNQAVDYLRRSYASDRDANGHPVDDDSGFVYVVQGDGTWKGVRDGANMCSASTTAAGLLAMQVCGEYDAAEVAGAARWLRQRPPRFGDGWFYYATYYYAQGMYQCGGEHADVARRHVRDELLKLQEADGSFKVGGSEGGAGPVYATSLAILSLGVKCHYLPIYQR